MRHALPALVLLLGACDEQAALDATLAAEAAAPSSTLTLSVTNPIAYGAVFDVTVTGANPGDDVFVVVGLGGTGAGPCPPFLGGNCMDILPPLRRPGAFSGTADATGTFTATFANFPSNIPVGTYAMQAVTRSGASSNESPVVSLDVLGNVTICADDAAEPDNDAATAQVTTSPISGTSCDRGSIGPDEDQDYIEVILAAGGTVDATAYFIDADADIDLFLVDAANLPAGMDWGDVTAVDVAGGTSVSDNETISYTSVAGGTYYLIVAMYEEGATGTTNPTVDGAPYDLEWTITP